MQGVSLVEPGLPVGGEVEDVLEAVVDAVALLVNVLDVELLAADQGVGLKK